MILEWKYFNYFYGITVKHGRANIVFPTETAILFYSCVVRSSDEILFYFYIWNVSNKFCGCYRIKSFIEWGCIIFSVFH